MFGNSVLSKDAGQILKGVITGLLISLGGVLAFALVIDLASLGDSVIRPVNQSIKLFAIFGGCAAFVKGERGYLKGAITGCLIVLFSFLIFGLIAGSLGDFRSAIIDIVCGTVMGLISGVISVNLPRRRP